MKANRLLLRALTRTAPSLSSQIPLHFSSAAAPKASAPISAAKAPKKKWKIFAVDSPPAGTATATAVKSHPPKTIEFREDIRNSASFVGTVTGPVQRIDAPGGRVGACASLLVRGSSDDNCSFKIILKMWDEMAEMCLEHVKQNDFLHVLGRVESYKKSDEIERSQTCCEVTVKEINYVIGCEPIPNDKRVGISDSRERENSSNDKSARQSENAEKSEFSPIEKDTGKPESGGVYGLEKQKARLRLWQQFFTNPSEWHDNRMKKSSPKSPDFKHKVSGEALWINGFDSPWLEEKLQQLDSKHKPPTGLVELYTKADENEKSQTRSEVIVKEPESEYIILDSGESENSSIENSAGQSEHSFINKNARKQDSGGVSGLGNQNARLRLWQQFFANPSEWDDNRTKKLKPNFPDFKNKSSGEALWINDKDPPWLKEKLQQFDSKLVAQDDKPPTGESLEQYPSESLKQQPSESSRQQSGESGLEKHRARLRMWQMFFTNPSKWFDNRNNKLNPKQPDFKNKETGEALWINRHDPPWVQVQLQQLDSMTKKQDLKQV